jgi:N utilization substance protein A
VSQGFFTFDDLSVIEPDQLAEIGGLSDEDCDKIVEYADRESQRLEAEEKIAAELKKQAAAQGEAPRPKAAPPVVEAAIQEPETVPPEVVVDSSPAVEE